MESLKSRSDHYQNGDEVFRYNERYEEHIRTAERTVPKERVCISTKRTNQIDQFPEIDNQKRDSSIDRSMMTKICSIIFHLVVHLMFDTYGKIKSGNYLVKFLFSSLK